MYVRGWFAVSSQLVSKCLKISGELCGASEAKTPAGEKVIKCFWTVGMAASLMFDFYLLNTKDATCRCEWLDVCCWAARKQCNNFFHW